jgi:hypothetical protein
MSKKRLRVRSTTQIYVQLIVYHIASDQLLFGKRSSSCDTRFSFGCGLGRCVSLLTGIMEILYMTGNIQW